MASFMLVSLALGVRLLLLARQSREVPELAMGLAFLLCGTAGYGQIVMAHATWESLPHLTPILLASGYLMVDLGAICLHLFTYGVFRRGQMLGRLLLGALATAIAGSFFIQAFDDGFGNPRLAGPASWLAIAALTGTFAWPAAESLRYWSMLRRRQRIGLADGALAQVFFWWGTGCASAALIFVTFAAMLIFQVNDITHPATAAATACFGGFAAFAIARAFHPVRHRPRRHPSAEVAAAAGDAGPQGEGSGSRRAGISTQSSR